MKEHARVLPLPGAPVTWTAVLFAAREKEKTPSKAAKRPSAPHMVSLKRIRKLSCQGEGWQHGFLGPLPRRPDGLGSAGLWDSRQRGAGGELRQCGRPAGCLKCWRAVLGTIPLGSAASS